MKREEKLNILNLDANQAKKFFLEAKNYCNLELPKYINFQELLEKLSLEMRNNNYRSIKQTDPENYSDINYILFNNKFVIKKSFKIKKRTNYLYFFIVIYTVFIFRNFKNFL